MATILVTGAAGQLGRDVVEHVGRHGDDVVGLDRSDFDLATDDASAVLAAHRPDAVINCAAYTAVDAAESDADAAFAANEHGVRRLAEGCAAHGAHLVHVSTDYVFDGSLDRPYREDDTTGPRSVYGRSKLAGEQAAAEVLGTGVTIARTSWVCGEHGHNMVSLVLRLAADPDQPLAFVDDQIGHPTFTTDLAAALRHLAIERPGGVIHTTNRRAVSWYGFVQEILAAAGHDPARVRPITTAELVPPRPAPRPANSVLENARWDAAGWTPLRDFAAPLAELVARLR
ncbi:MAG: dTDP-4-dehydrorhamnose reductase [Actinomycetota bacterium]